MSYRHNFLVVYYNNKKESNMKIEKNHYYNAMLSAHSRTRIKGLTRRTKVYYNNGTCRISTKIVHTCKFSDQHKDLLILFCLK